MPVRLPGRCNYDSRPQNPQEGGWVGVDPGRRCPTFGGWVGGLQPRVARPKFTDSCWAFQGVVGVTRQAGFWELQY
jgi:hypothetical protein